MKLTLGQVADWIHAEGDFANGAEALGYSIDSRTLGAGDLFFAVRGDRFDGHDFVEAALADGAVAAVVSMRWLAPAEVDAARLLRVPDGPGEDGEGDGVLLALQRLARAVRRSWGGRVIGVTGSAGKTTTKDAVAEVLAARGIAGVLKSQGNLNNGFGLPLQLLKLEPEHQVAVIEMGMNHAGEIAALARIAEPDWAVVTNVAPVHLEHFADGIGGVARAKYELVEALPPDGLAVLNGDDDRVAAFARGMGDRAVLYGMREGLAVQAASLAERGLDGTTFEIVAGESRWPIVLRLPGRHNVMNALAAFAVGLRSGVDPADAIAALERMQPTEKRGNILEWRGAKIVNDTYNSNPRALQAMIEALAGTGAARRIVLAGEMLELGPDAAALHHACGAFAAEAGLDVVVGVRGLAASLVEGARARGASAEFVATPEEAGAWLVANVRAGDVVLLKASRGVRLERALESLC